ncbi:hypothetical protein [Bradyrhizobium sp. JYMT SZCCT0428]|uniref:hypothetical protein n=1 Tax=Bradyrhizobium sp. JYMT SZCCT0428 TaxID=2807673 RepID=UPI001BA5985C|nr:hypothetical protein [Bradyrhizobium sp. JYMT SZCCT0428]MBR1150089.1 hypothetical protein [Bradyrhizobium sp. JYMT SZCCT0428]
MDGFGEMVVFLAAAAAFGIPAALGLFVGLVLALYGFHAAGVIVAAAGVVAGLIFALWVKRQA